MKITIRPLFGKIKNFTTEYTKAFASMISGFIFLITSATFHLHSLWQLDLICVEPVWNTPMWIARNPEYLITPFASNPNFRDGPLFAGTVGQAYDFFLGMNHFGWAFAIIGTFFIMLGIILFYRANMLEAKKDIEWYQKEINERDWADKIRSDA